MRYLKLLTLSLLFALPITTHAAPCLAWESPLYRVDGSPLYPYDIQEYRINWVRIKPRTNSVLRGTVLGIKGNTHCFSATASYQYTFEAVTVDTDGQVSAPSNQVRWGAWK